MTNGMDRSYVILTHDHDPEYNNQCTSYLYKFDSRYDLPIWVKQPTKFNINLITSIIVP